MTRKRPRSRHPEATAFRRFVFLVPQFAPSPRSPSPRGWGHAARRPSRQHPRARGGGIREALGTEPGTRRPLRGPGGPRPGPCRRPPAHLLTPAFTSRVNTGSTWKETRTGFRVSVGWAGVTGGRPRSGGPTAQGGAPSPGGEGDPRQSSEAHARCSSVGLSRRSVGKWGATGPGPRPPIPGLGSEASAAPGRARSDPP